MIQYYTVGKGFMCRAVRLACEQKLRTPYVGRSESRDQGGLCALTCLLGHGDQRYYFWDCPVARAVVESVQDGWPAG